MKINLLTTIPLLLLLTLNTFSHNLSLRYIFTNPNFYKCLQQLGTDKIMLYYLEEPDKASVTQIIKAKNQGMNVDALYLSCRNRSIQSVARLMRQNFGNNIVSKFWISPISQDQTQMQCNWEGYDHKENCQYLVELILAMGKYGFIGNVVTNLNQWKLIFGSGQACTEVAKAQLWWVPVEEDQNWKPDFLLYEKIGGWQKPYMKLYQKSNICGENVFNNYYE